MFSFCVWLYLVGLILTNVPYFQADLHFHRRPDDRTLQDCVDIIELMIIYRQALGCCLQYTPCRSPWTGIEGIVQTFTSLT